MGLSVGEVAPDFMLAGIDGSTGRAGTFSLGSYRGGPVVVVFYPGDNSAVCTAQLVDYTSGIKGLDDLGVAVLAISPQDVDSHRSFAAANGGFAFPLLSDPGKKVGRAWGNLGLLDLYRRSTVVLDADGVVRYTQRHLGPGLSFKPIGDVIAAVARSID